MNREVCSAERRSVEPMKMKIIQSRTGSQYLMNQRSFMGRTIQLGRARLCRAETLMSD